MTQPTISIDLINRTMDYMATKPWAEVNELIKEWQDAGKQPEVPAEEPKPDNED